MICFSHKDVQPRTFVTGDLPDAICGEEFGAQRGFNELLYSDRCSLWSGCLDAPEYVPAGSTYGRLLSFELFAGPSAVRRCKG